MDAPKEQHWKQLLYSSQLADQVEGLQEACKAISMIADEAVNALSLAGNKIIYADRLSRLGPVIIPSIEKRFVSYPDGELKTTAALLLLHFGSTSGLSQLMSVLSRDNENCFLVATKLANAGINEAAEPILQLLRDVICLRPLDDKFAPEIAALVSALRKLSVPIPADIQADLTSPGVPKTISSLFMQNS